MAYETELTAQDAENTPPAAQAAPQAVGTTGDPDVLLIAAASTSRQPFLVLTTDLTVQHANAAFLALSGRMAPEVLGQPLFALGAGQWDIPSLRTLLGEVLPHRDVVDAYRIDYRVDGSGPRVLLVNARYLKGRGQFPDRVLVAMEEVTERERLRGELVARRELSGKLIDKLRQAALLLGPEPKEYRGDTLRPVPDFSNAKRGTKAAAQALRESEQRLRLASHAAQLGVFEWDVENDRAHWENPRMYEIFGRTREQGPLSRAVFMAEVIDPHDQATFEQALREAMQPDQLLRVVCRIRRCNDGAQRWIKLSGRFDLAPDGSARRLLGVVTDITERKRAEQKLQASEEQWRRLLALLPVAVYVCDAQGRITYFNQRAVELWGRTPRVGERDERFCGSFRLYHPDGRPLPHDQTPMVEAIRNGSAYRDLEVVMEQPQGRRVHVSVNIDPLLENGRIVGAINCFVDQTERRLVQTRLRDSEARFRQLADAMPQLVWSAGADGSVDYYNRRACEFSGFDCSGEGQRGWRPVLHPEDLERTLRAWRAALDGGHAYQCEHRVRTVAGAWRWHLSRAVPVRDEAGSILRWFGTATDIHDLTLARQALQHLTETLEQQVAERTRLLERERNFIDSVLDNQPAPVLVLDGDGRLVRFNKACETATGRSFEELLGSSAWMELVPAGERDSVQQMLDTLGSAQAPIRHENHWCHRDGSQRLFVWNNRVLRDAAGCVQYIIASGLDITEQRQAELAARQHLEEAARLQRLQTADELATVLAHEVNQPLAAIAAFAETSQHLLRQAPLDQEMLAEILQHIGEQALRGGEIIRRLRSFVRKGRIDPSPLDLNRLVQQACTLIRRKAQDCGVSLDLMLADDLPPVMGVSVHLEQVLLNLLSNAVEAIQDAGMAAGSISVETRRVNGKARVTVRDSGPGVGAAGVDALFDPLASAKEYGLGVGLRISRSLIEAHGGRLWVEPQQPGAVFHFELSLTA